MAAKGGLGRGLSALFEEVSVNPDTITEEVPKEAKSAEKSTGKAEAKKTAKPSAATKSAAEKDDRDRVLYLDIHKLKPNSDQPRQEFDPEKIAELADSIREYGVLQPIMVRKAKSGYEIVAGERRWRAAAEAGLKVVPCLMRELTEEQNMVIALVENIQRENLNAIEEAEALEKMIHRYGLTQEQVSKSVGRSRPYIANALRLLKLPREVRELLASGALSAGHARAIAGIKDEQKQITAARLTVENGWSVRQTELFAGEKKESTKPRKPRNSNKSAEVRTVEEDLKRILGTKVNLVMSGKRGRIEIEYYSREELDRLIELLQSLE